MNIEVKYYPAGDKCIQVKLGDVISPELNKEVRKLYLGIKSMNIKGITEFVPTYSTLSIYYNPLMVTYDWLTAQLKDAQANLKDLVIPEPYITEIPTCYDKDFAFDLDFVAKHNGITTDEVIDIHSRGEYLIYMLGFTPGYCYLGGMSEKIAAPRLQNPRTLVPAGSVGIAGMQTGIYPIESPGGWQIIGRTPIELYNPLRNENPILLEAGNYIKFKPITRENYQIIKQEVAQGSYNVKKYLKR